MFGHVAGCKLFYVKGPPFNSGTVSCWTYPPDVIPPYVLLIYHWTIPRGRLLYFKSKRTFLFPFPLSDAILIKITAYV